MHPSITISPLLPTEVDTAYPLCADEPALHGQLLWHVYTPDAHAVKAVVDGELCAFAYAHAHATTGWVREVFVHPGHFGTGVGTALVQALVQWLVARGTTAQGVVAAPGTEHFFARLGFVPELELLGYSGGRFKQAQYDEVVSLEPQHLLGVLHLDRKVCGEDRSTWLREHLYLGNVWAEGTQVRGFLLPLAGRGLIVADAPLVGLELQRWLWPVQHELVLPVGAVQAHAHLLDLGHTTRPVGLRMWRGPAPLLHPERVFAWPQGWG
ncbi:MAG: GNAT family N-acetyltransferase [Flavobacteriales bacterium]|nr:GNAT family N-acetyltransferase [Flavobacteriales bacterium]